MCGLLHLWMTPEECRKCSPRATSSATCMWAPHNMAEAEPLGYTHVRTLLVW
jgi:hypothetical protein